MTVSRDHYYLLASNLEGERISAAAGLITELSEANDESEWAYSLERLIKGLSSSRGSARLGFSMCLSEIMIMRISERKLAIADLLELIDKHTKIASSMNGKEERSMLFGKLFGLQALAGLLVKLENTDLSEFNLVISALVELSTLKSWIREPSLFTIFNLLNSPLPDDLIIHIFSEIDHVKLSLSIEGLALYLAVPTSKKNELFNKIHFKNKTWNEFNPLDKSNISLMSKVLKDVAVADESNTTEDGKDVLKKKGNWSPRLHFVWKILIDELTKEETDSESYENVENSKKRSKSDSKKSKKLKKSSNFNDSNLISIKEFWKVIINEGFFSEKSSHERKYWGFEIFELVLPKISINDTSILFSNNFMRTLINQSSDNKRFLSKIAKKTLNSIVEVTKTQPLKIKPILNQLLIGEFGNLQFDRLTKSKTVELMLKNSNDLTNLEVSEFFISILNDCSNNNDESIKRSKWVIDQLLHFVRYNKNVLSSNSDMKWVDLILKSLVLKAYFKPNDDEENSIAPFAQERLNSILSDVISIPRTDTQTWSYKTLTFLLSEFENSNSDLKPIFTFDDEISQTLNKTFKILRKIRSVRESTNHLDNPKLLIFELLNSMVLLQLYTGDFAESVEILTELQDYYYNSIKGSSENDNDVIGIVEILLNFLSQKSALLKKLSYIVWENYCDKIDIDCLELLFNVINTKENKEGQKALFEAENEFVEEDDEEEDEDGEHDHEHTHSHGHEHDHSHDNGDDESSSSDESESNEESEEEFEEEEEEETKETEKVDEKSKIEEVEKKTNVALAEALKIPHNGEVILSSDEDDFSDESMDDEQMMEIDGQLAQIFKQRQDALSTVNGKSGSVLKLEVEEARSNITLFKNRVVDLLEIFVKKNPDSELIVLMVLPLLRGLKLTLDKSLAVKIFKLLRNKICKSKIEKLTIVNEDELIETLEKILHKDYMLKNSNTNDFNSASSQCSIFISKQIIELNEDSVDKIIDIYSNLLKNWFKKKNSNLPSTLFFDFIYWLNSKKNNK